MKTQTWHRPLLVLAVAMAALVIPTVFAAAIDPRTVSGSELWLKPLKFELSIGLYALTLSWLVGQLDRLRRVASIAGTISVVGLSVEMVIIGGVAAAGETSHFNVSTPFHTALWATMAVSIVVVWSMTLVVAIALFRNRLGDPARTIAIRAGIIIAFVGMGLAFLMTSPTAAQLANYQGIVGAHTVGLPDGGPGLPLVGWSTFAGDLRIPHFVGMHALQVLPLVVIVLELLGRRVRVVAEASIRRQLVVIATVTYASAVAILTWQALAGQSIARPSGAVLVAALSVAAGCLAAVARVLAVARRRPPAATPVEAATHSV